MCAGCLCCSSSATYFFFFSFFFFQTGSLPGLRLTKEAGLASYAARDPLVSTSLVLGSFWEWSSASSAFKASILMAEPSPQPKGSPFPPRSSTLLCPPPPPLSLDGPHKQCPIHAITLEASHWNMLCVPRTSLGRRTQGLHKTAVRILLPVTPLHLKPRGGAQAEGAASPPVCTLPPVC